MQLDWITIAAQIANFLVLVWLLQRFLYAPIMGAMERREQRIADRLREAERKGAEAEREADAFRARQEELDRQRAQLLAEAKDAAEQERAALERTARDQVEQRRQEWLRQLQEQREEYLRDLRQRATEHFCAMARRALDDLADARLEEQIVHMFLQELAALDNDTRKKIAAEGRKAGNIVTARSRFQLPAAEKRRITEAVHERILEGAEVLYEASPEATVGLELKAGGQTVSWSLGGYFDSLESRIAGELEGYRPLSG